MEADVLDWVERVGKAADVVGVAVIVVGALWASGLFLCRMFVPSARGDAYRLYRHGLGRAILLGLEILVAADIIRTVAVRPTLESVAVLGGIVLIRTFLSVSLEMEIDGRWPWQRRERRGEGATEA